LSPRSIAMSVRIRFVLVTLAAVAVALLTARLGFWQLSRAAEKNTLQAAIEQRALEPVLDGLPSDAQPAAALHHRRVQLRGRWSAAHTVYLDNRQMNGRPGFFVVTPLVLHDGRAVLVQRGWLPRNVDERTRIDDAPPPAGDVSIEGRIAPPPARLFEFEGADTGRIRQNLDLDAFARETGLTLAPLSVLQTGPAAPADKLGRDWPAPASGVAKHYGYAFQWFALSTLVVILYVWFQFIQPRRAHRR
jgi:surfeit locus 1 family protein